MRNRGAHPAHAFWKLRKAARQAVAPKQQSFCEGTEDFIWPEFRSYVSFWQPGLAAISEPFIFKARRSQSENACGLFHRRLIFMIFDIITVLILFQIINVFSRLIGQRHGDVLDYVSRK
jgi:hypothetical protein